MQQKSSLISSETAKKNMNQVKYCDLIDCENNEDARSGHRMVVINDILYVIGNYDNFTNLYSKTTSILGG